MMGYEIRLMGGNTTNEGRVEVKGSISTKSNKISFILLNILIYNFSPWGMGSYM